MVERGWANFAALCLLLAGFVLVVGSLPARAGEHLSLRHLNQLISQTNFIVNKGCSGTLIHVEEKLILTNHHCVDDVIKTVEVEEEQPDGTLRKIKRRIRQPIVVEQNTYDKVGRITGSRTSRAEVVRADAGVDLALVRAIGEIGGHSGSSLLPDGREIQRGERVYIVGNPAGLEASLVEGVISSVRREIPEFSTPYGKPWEALQFSGGIFGGNSGGALYNAEGYLIGVPAAGMTRATFIGFAVPIDAIKQFLGEACVADKVFGGKNDKICTAPTDGF